MVDSLHGSKETQMNLNESNREWDGEKEAGEGFAVSVTGYGKAFTRSRVISSWSRPRAGCEDLQISIGCSQIPMPIGGKAFERPRPPSHGASIWYCSSASCMLQAESSAAPSERGADSEHSQDPKIPQRFTSSRSCCVRWCLGRIWGFGLLPLSGQTTFTEQALPALASSTIVA